jgi:RNA-directed DNA polymerase
MTSAERKARRRQRRIAKRESKRLEYIKKYNSLEKVADVDSLYASYKKSREGVSWKESVQRYDVSLMKNLIETKRALLNGDNVTKGFVEFDIHERGKIRHIRSVHISERVVQKCFCDNVLVPLFSRSLIYDNGASIKNKGIHFAMKRLRTHLNKFYNENKSYEGYALVIDFSKYFDNILHDKLFEIQKKNFTDKRLFELYKSFITVFGDNKSLGLGSQVSQISAISYPNKLDHYCKEVLKIKYYGRYMDDTYLIHKDKKYLEYCLTKITEICSELGIKINQKKTKIVSLYDGFWFLKGKYSLLSSGKIICKADRKGCIRMRRKLKKFKIMLDKGEMKLSDIYTSYQSFRSHLLKFDSYHLVKNMDKFYKELFRENITMGGSKNEYYRKCILSDKRRCSRTSY